MRSILIIGNGPIAAGTAAALEKADFIVRFNECRSFEASQGRTDAVAVCNTGRPGKAMLAAPTFAEHRAVREAREIWSVRDPAFFAALKPRLALEHPELDDFCDDYTQGFAAFAASRGKIHRIVPARIHEGLDRDLQAFAPEPYVVPSSGLIVIADLLARNPEAQLILSGFTHQGWEWHPFSAERRMVAALVAKGRLLHLDAAAGEARPAAE